MIASRLVSHTHTIQVTRVTRLMVIAVFVTIDTFSMVVRRRGSIWEYGKVRGAFNDEDVVLIRERVAGTNCTRM